MKKYLLNLGFFVHLFFSTIVFSTIARAQMAKIFGPQDAVMSKEDLQSFSYAFAGSPTTMPGMLLITAGLLQSEDHEENEVINIPDSLHISFNGKTFSYSEDILEKNNQFQIPVMVQANNFLTVRLTGNKGSRIQIEARAYLPVVASFNMSPTTGIAPKLISLSALTSYSPNAAIASYNWNFGDGSVGTGALVLHNYMVSGTFNVTLTVTDLAGIVGTQSQSLVILPDILPQALIKSLGGTGATGGGVGGIAPLLLSFDASGSTNPQGSPLSFTWNFGDASPVASGIKLVHEFKTSGIFNVTLTATNALGGSSTANLQVQVLAPVLPPAPETLAPILASNAPTSFDQQISFLYSGTQPLQTNVLPGALQANRQSVLRGQILDGDGLPLTGVTVTVKDHSEFGKTLSRADGYFDLVANGGGAVTLNFSRNGYLPAQRIVSTNANDFAVLQNISLVKLDNKVTTVTANAPTAQFVQGSTTTDTRGIRSGAMFIPANTAVTATLPNGSTQTLSNLGLRITEYTAGPNGQNRMPAELPPNSAYTYAMDVTADEALVLGSHNLQFSNPVAYYLDNFLTSPVGTSLPVASYNFDKTQWMPSTDGVVVKILSVDPQGLATLDIDGSGTPATANNLALLGVTSDERRALAQNYAINKSLWRVTLNHFSPLDINYNFHVDIPILGGDPQKHASENPNPKANKICPGCRIDLNQGNMAETIALWGSDLNLNYSTERQPGRASDSSVTIGVYGDLANPASRGIIGATVTFSILGQVYTQSFGPTAGATANFTWNGKDAYGRDVFGTYPASIRTSYIFGSVYGLTKNTPGMGSSFGSSLSPSSTTMVSSVNQTIGSKTTVYLRNTQRSIIGNLTGELGGWSLDMHHHFDPVENKIYYGNGTATTLSVQPETLSTIAAGAAGIASPQALLRMSDGSLLVSNATNILRLTSTGSSLTGSSLTGSSLTGSSLTGSSALFANIAGATAMALGIDDSVYATVPSGNQVYKIDPNGLVSIFAGTGTAGFSGDGALAINAKLSSPQGIAADKSGNIFISDTGNHVVRRVRPDGVIETFIGQGGLPGSTVGLALSSKLNSPRGLSFDCSGNLYIVDAGNYSVRVLNFASNTTVAIGPPMITMTSFTGLMNLNSIVATCNTEAFVSDSGNGYIYKFSGSLNQLVARVGTLFNTAPTANTDGLSSEFIKLRSPAGFLLDKDGALIFAENGQNAIRRFGQPRFVATNGVFSIASKDGSEVYQFDSMGKHLRTLFGKTGANKFLFSYDANNFLIAITDSSGNVTSLLRDAAGHLVRIQSPFGQNYSVSLDPNGYLASLTEPTGEIYNMSYTNNGLLTRFAPPKGNANTYSYSAGGKLATDTNPLNYTKTLTPASVTIPFSLSSVSTNQLISPMGRKSSIGEFQDNATFANPTVYSFHADGLYDTFTNYSGSRYDNYYGHGTILGVVDSKLDPRLMGITSYPIMDIVRTGYNYSGLSSHVRTVVMGTSLFDYTQTDAFTIDGLNSTAQYSSITNTQSNTSALGRTDSVQLDNLERPVRINNRGYASTNMTYTPQGFVSQIAQGARSTSMRYDQNGHLSTLTDALGRVFGYVYDLSGKLKSQTLPDGRTQQFTYDANGNMIRLTPANTFNFDFVLNALDLVTQFVLPSIVQKNGALIGTPTQYVYNPDNELTQVVRPDGSTINYNYGLTDGRFYGVTAGSESTTVAYATTGAYNYGMPVSVVSSDGSIITFKYDTFFVKSYYGLFNLDFMVAYNFGTGNRVAGRGSYAGGNLNTVFSDIIYDLDGLYINVSGVNFSRNANGAISAAGLGSISELFTYDSFGELSTYSSKYLTSLLYNMTLTRDNLGRITNKTETVLGTATSFNYTYDLAGRLSAVSVNGVPTSVYSYDANSNRTSVVTGGTTRLYAVDAQDRLVSVDNIQYQYDANGDLKSKLQPGGLLTQYSFSALGQLRSVSLPNGNIISYKLDGENHRAARLVNGVVTSFYAYDETGRLFVELDSRGIPRWTYHYAPGASSPEAISNNHSTVTYRLIKDQLGSIRLVVNPTTGSVVQRIDYDEFGNITLDTNPGFQGLGFAGGIYDPDTKLTLFGARSFDPQVGRWISRDPIGFGGGSTNLYSYVVNDPVNFIDPRGLTTTLITTYDYGIGSHSAILVQTPGQRSFLYDPAGSFPQTGSGNFLFGATLAQYVAYQQSTGSGVQTTVLNTTPAQEAAIIQNAMNIGGQSPPLCANSVSGALNGACGISGSVFPGILNNQAKSATCP